MSGHRLARYILDPFRIRRLREAESAISITDVETWIHWSYNKADDIHPPST